MPKRVFFFMAAVVLAASTGTVVGGCGNESTGGGIVPDAHVPCTPFRSVLTEPYLTGFDGVDVSSAVTCGEPPYLCLIYSGVGDGTVPGGVTQDPADTTGCTLIGDVDTNDPSGNYGFIMIVRDSLNGRLEIPIYWPGNPCSTDHVTLDPAENPARVETSGSEYQWTVSADDVDYPCDDVSCGTCRACVHMRFLVLEPITGADGLDCVNTGDVCSDCGAGCVPLPPACPHVDTMSRVLQVRSHAAIRESPSWVTMEFELNYTGDDVANCADKHWLCHMEVLETQ